MSDGQVNNPRIVFEWEWQTKIREKDAEIERLSKLYRAALEALVEKDSLITELTDALARYHHDYGEADCPHCQAIGLLIQKAREACLTQGPGSSTF